MNRYFMIWYKAKYVHGEEDEGYATVVRDGHFNLEEFKNEMKKANGFEKIIVTNFKEFDNEDDFLDFFSGYNNED